MRSWRCCVNVALIVIALCALELDPGYVDTVIRRWQALTGGSARHAVSGRSFDDLAREMEAGNAVSVAA
jgi:hypothetical protein